MAIIYLCWSEEPYKYLDSALEGIEHQTYPRELIKLFIVYNSHRTGEQTACSYIRQRVAERQVDLPAVTILEQNENLGFVGGNNVGMRWAMAYGCDYVFLHNADGCLAGQAIEKLVVSLEKDKNIGAAQSLVLLDPERNLINSAGNNYHFLGFGYCDLYRQNRAESKSNEIRRVGYLSGAAMMMRVDLLKQHGLWDEDYFIYHDDLEYSLRLKSLGYSTVLVPDSEFYHQYRYSRNPDKYYLMERNRWIVLLTYYKPPTMLLILPGLILMEVGLIFFSLIGGWFRQKIRGYAWWLHGKNWRMVLAKRKARQSERKVGDMELLKQAVGRIEFAEVNNWVLKYAANPFMAGYWWMLRKIIYW